MGKESDSKLFAFLGVFLTIIGFIIVLLTRKNDKYAMYYAKQGLILFIALIALQIVGFVLAITLIGAPLALLLWVAWMILWIIAIINSLSGNMKPTPVIGRFADKLKF